MSYRRRTLRGMPPTTRDIARLLDDAESVIKRLKNRLELFQTLEIKAAALDKMASDIGSDPRQLTLSSRASPFKSAEGAPSNE